MLFGSFPFLFVYVAIVEIASLTRPLFFTKIYLSDLFTAKSSKSLENALTETLSGTLSYNGQRCTALKLLFVPKEYGDTFAKALVKKVEGEFSGIFT